VDKSILEGKLSEIRRIRTDSKQMWHLFARYKDLANFTCTREPLEVFAEAKINKLAAELTTSDLCTLVELLTRAK